MEVLSRQTKVEEGGGRTGQERVGGGGRRAPAEPKRRDRKERRLGMKTPDAPSEALAKFEREPNARFIPLRATWQTSDELRAPKIFY